MYVNNRSNDDVDAFLNLPIAKMINQSPCRKVKPLVRNVSFFVVCLQSAPWIV